MTNIIANYVITITKVRLDVLDLIKYGSVTFVYTYEVLWRKAKYCAAL
jgi:hypothetical protein